MEKQKLNIVIDNIERIVELWEVVELNNHRYAIYTYDDYEEDTTNFLASLILTDEEGYEYFTDVEDDADREKLFEIADELAKNEGDL